ncbi:hypothetical protein [Sagittula sp. S175]|uniref:hypothetical protein n=1 Tax=Sagittula sp. S175 TaxID=3415129 RepID=UPI003C7BEEBE
MPALTQDRNTPRAQGDTRQGAVAAGETIYAGALVMRDASGNLVAGRTATGLVGVGRAEEQVDNATGAAGDKSLTYRPGVFRYANSAAADEITAADIGKAAYAVDDQTVAKTSATSTRSKAGIIDNVDAQGVWVRLDEALTNAS